MVSRSCCVYSHVTVLPWNYHRTGTKASWNGKAMTMEIIKRGVMPLKMLQCNLLWKSACIYNNKGLISAKLCHMRIFTYSEQPLAPTGLCTVSKGLRPCWVFSVSMHMDLFWNWKHLLFPGLSWQPAQKAACFMFISAGRSQLLWSYLSSAKNINSNLTIFHPFLVFYYYYF